METHLRLKKSKIRQNPRNAAVARIPQQNGLPIRAAILRIVEYKESAAKYKMSLTSVKARTTKKPDFSAKPRWANARNVRERLLKNGLSYICGARGRPRKKLRFSLRPKDFANQIIEPEQMRKLLAEGKTDRPDSNPHARALVQSLFALDKSQRQSWF